MGTVVDTSVLIAVERGQLNASRLRDHEDQATVLAAVTASELLEGVHRAQSAVHRTRRERFVEGTLATFTIVPFGLEIAGVHARLAVELDAAGTRIGEADLMIAATAVWLDYRIATRDLRSFPKIPNLDVVRW